MTPLDILPYYLALEPAPTDARSAFALARPVPDGMDIGVSVVLEDQSQCVEVFKFSRLDSVKIVWSACGRFLAFAQGSTLMVRDPSGALRLGSLDEDIRWLGFDEEQRLWCLAGARLEARVDNCLETAIDAVECAAASGIVAYCRREKAGLCIYLHDGGCVRQLACLSESREYLVVRLSLHGSYLAVVLVSKPIHDRARVRIVRFDISTAEMDPLLDEHIAIGFNGGPHINAVTSSTGEVLAAYERGACSRVWSLAAGQSPTPVSPDGFEVFDFASNPSGNRLAIVASDTRSAPGAFERQLLVGERDRTGWRFLAPRRGVYEMPRWRQDGRLDVLSGRDGHWTRRVFAPDEADEPVEDAGWCDSVGVSKGDLEYDVLRLSGPRHRQAAIVLLPRLHQQFVAGAQSFFFHQLLFAVARALAADGYSVAVLSGPGAIGRGRSRREPAGSYFLQIRSALDDLAQSLRAEGCRSIGILAGSLAAVPALRVLGPGTRFSACAFLVPLLEASIPVTEPVRRHLLDDPSVEPLDDAAGDLQVPLMVVSGASDEVVPLSQIARLRKRAQKTIAIELCVFEDEGHIFKQARSWRRTQSAIESFFSSHLVVGLHRRDDQTSPRSE